MIKDIKQYIATCDNCQRAKRPLMAEPSLKSIEATIPNSLICFDIWGPLQGSENGMIAVLFVTDLFTKFTLGFPLKTMTAEETAQALVNGWFLVFGIPDSVLSDNAKTFKNAVMTEVTTLLGVKQLFGTPYSPTTQGGIERFNRTIANAVRIYADQSNGFDWDRYIAPLCYAYNCTPHTSTKFAPFELQFGRKPKLPIDKVLKSNFLSYKIDLDTFHDRLEKHLNKAFAIAKENLAKAQTAQKVFHDIRGRDISIKVGDTVLVERKKATKGQTNKLKHIFHGPYPVIAVNYPQLTVKLQNGREQKVQVRYIRKYHDRSAKLHETETEETLLTSTLPVAVH